MQLTNKQTRADSHTLSSLLRLTSVSFHLTLCLVKHSGYVGEPDTLRDDMDSGSQLAGQRAKAPPPLAHGCEAELAGVDSRPWVQRDGHEAVRTHRQTGFGPGA